ncbi:MAG TPA: hypothetical protein VMV95_01510 [Bacillota bacterium]|nr:hypothetical protein [Bacillota bacterium]
MINKLYFLLQKCKAENIYFLDADLKETQGQSIGGDYDVFICGINIKLSEDEKIVTLLHERLHDHPIFKKYEAIPYTDIEKAMETEMEITGLARKIIDSKPHVKNYLLEQIRSANPKVLDFKQSFIHTLNFLNGKHLKCT